MSQGFSFNREFDFVRLDGLRRATGRPPHEWDLYIVKELVDNALDADDILWSRDASLFPRLEVRIEYIPLPEQQSQQLFIQVRNRSRFPVEQIDAIFATQWYTSRKGFIKGLTRGALGNALKTLLGIPYALRNRVAGDWSPELKPLSILCDGVEYLPRYEVDSQNQHIRFTCETRARKFEDGTLISIGIDSFEQEVPRTLRQIETFAQQYFLCNPYVQFQWTVEIEGLVWTQTFEPQPTWKGKFMGVAPVHWYSYSAFQDLLGALYREEQHEHHDTSKLSVEKICTYFGGFSGPPPYERNLENLSLTDIVQTVGKNSLTKAEIEGPVGKKLYLYLTQHTPPFTPFSLGAIGRENVSRALSQAFSIEGEILYESSLSAEGDHTRPFVIEGALARLKEGKRTIWTAINFTPTYGDPFLRRLLFAPVQPSEPVQGLSGLLDVYEWSESTPLVLFLHLICPNIEHHEFSKTEIDHQPFKENVGLIIDQLLVTLKQAIEAEERHRENIINQALDVILSDIGGDERFILSQLLEKLRMHLRQDPSITAWLEQADTYNRLQGYIATYLQQSPILTQHVARPAIGTINIPLHPDHHFSIPVEQVSREILTRSHVNKVLFIESQELVPVAIDNGWLCKMDMALLHAPLGLQGLQDIVVQCVVKSEVPLLVLHNADEQGVSILKQIHEWVQEHYLKANYVYDMGLESVNGEQSSAQTTKLIEIMPKELATLLVNRLKILGIPVKAFPSDAEIRRDISDRFEKMLRGPLVEGIWQRLEMTRLMIDLDAKLGFSMAMMNQALDEQLKRRLSQESCLDSYVSVLEKVVEEFFEDLMYKQGAEIQRLARLHIDGESGESQ